MAKKKQQRSAVSSQQSAISDQPAERQPAESPPATVLEPTQHVPQISIEIPLGPVGNGYQPRHVDAQLRTAAQRAAMRRVFTGLDLTGARTQNGKRVTNNVESLLWLLEQVAAGMET